MKFIQIYVEDCPEDYISLEEIERFSVYCWNDEEEEGCYTVMALPKKCPVSEGWCISTAFEHYEEALDFMNNLIKRINK